MLTGLGSRRGKRRRGVVGEVQRRRCSGARGEGDAEGARAPGPLVSTCGAPAKLVGVKGTRGPTAARNRGGGSAHRRRRSWQNSARSGLGSRDDAVETLQAARECCCAAWPGLRCGGAAWPRRRRGLFTAERCGRGELGFGAALAWRMKYRGERAVLIGRRSVLGVRARDGNLAGDLGVTVTRAEGAEGMDLASAPGWSAAERASALHGVGPEGDA